MKQIPNGITILGLVLRLLFVAGALGTWAALAGTILDNLDGYVARKYGWTSVLGAELDWHADCAVALLATLAMAAQAGPGAVAMASTGLVVLWARNKSTGTKVSGAAASMVLLAVAREL